MDWVQIFVFWGSSVAIGPRSSYHAIVVESDLFNSKFYFAGFDLYTGFI